MIQVCNKLRYKFELAFIVYFLETILSNPLLLFISIYTLLVPYFLLSCVRFPVAIMCDLLGYLPLDLSPRGPLTNILSRSPFKFTVEQRVCHVFNEITQQQFEPTLTVVYNLQFHR